MPRIGIYLRLSDDRDGNQTATDRQLQDCRRYAHSKGWEVADVFEDIDLSAYRRGVHRAEFERMLEAVRAKAIDGVLAWKIDRITRRQRDLVRLDEAAEEVRAFIATVVEGIDTRQPTGRFVAELLVAQARMESENASIRIKRKHEELAILGRPQTGGTRMFGYSQDRQAVVAEEAALVREATTHLLAGRSLVGLCREWERRGVRTPAGGAWKPSPLRRLLKSAALSGQREHLGRITAGSWPPILTPVETMRLRALLDDPARNKVINPRRYLLAGCLRCGHCGHSLSSRPRIDGVRRYVCAKRPGDPNCGKLARLARPVEDVVRDAVVVALDGVDLREHVSQPEAGLESDLRQGVREDEEALEELSRDYYVDRRIDRVEFFAARDAIQGRLEHNRKELARTNVRGTLNEIVGAGEQVARQWDAQSIDWKRAVIHALIDHVVIEPAVKGRNFFDPTLVRIVWKF